MAKLERSVSGKMKEKRALQHIVWLLHHAEKIHEKIFYFNNGVTAGPAVFSGPIAWQPPGHPKCQTSSEPFQQRFSTAPRKTRDFFLWGVTLLKFFLINFFLGFKTSSLLRGSKINFGRGAHIFILQSNFFFGGVLNSFGGLGPKKS